MHFFGRYRRHFQCSYSLVLDSGEIRRETTISPWLTLVWFGLFFFGLHRTGACGLIFFFFLTFSSWWWVWYNCCTQKNRKKKEEKKLWLKFLSELWVWWWTGNPKGFSIVSSLLGWINRGGVWVHGGSQLWSQVAVVDLPSQGHGNSSPSISTGIHLCDLSSFPGPQQR